MTPSVGVRRRHLPRRRGRWKKTVSASSLENGRAAATPPVPAIWAGVSRGKTRIQR